MPTEVLPGFLFLGSYDHASRAELLKALGIAHILNVSWLWRGLTVLNEGCSALGVLLEASCWGFV
mgnify:CR=1 FL=1